MTLHCAEDVRYAVHGQLNNLKKKQNKTKQKKKKKKKNDNSYNKI